MNGRISIDDINLLHLIYFHGSITKASESAGMSQSNVSKKLKSVEDRLGVELFQRSTRKLTITPAGQRFLENTASIPQTIDAAISELKNHNIDNRFIQLDLSSSLTNAHIPGFIRKQEVIDDINLRVAQHSQQSIIKRLVTYSTDIAILPYTHELDKVATIHQQIDDHFVLLISASQDPPSMKRFTKWASQQKWILPERSDITHYLIKSWLRQEIVDSNVTMEIPNFDLINHLVALGHGVAIVPQRSLSLFYNRKLLRVVKLGKDYTRKIAIASPIETSSSNKIQSFLDSIVFS